jgi:hypothetical protein
LSNGLAVIARIAFPGSSLPASTDIAASLDNHCWRAGRYIRILSLNWCGY